MRTKQLATPLGISTQNPVFIFSIFFVSLSFSDFSRLTTMGGESTHPALHDPTHPSSSRDPKTTPHVSVSVLPGQGGLTPSLDPQQLTQHLEERDAKMAAMRAQLAKLSETIKKAAMVEVTATSRGAISTQRRSAKDRLGNPNDEMAQSKALVLRHKSPSIEHLSRGDRVQTSQHRSSQISKSSTWSPYSQLSATDKTLFYLEDGQYKPSYG